MSQTDRHRTEGRADAFVALTLARTIPKIDPGHLADVLGITRDDVADAMSRLRVHQGTSRRKPGPNPPGEKWCPSCAQYRPVTKFCAAGHTGDGLQNYCRTCRAERRNVSPPPSDRRPPPLPHAIPDHAVDVIIEEADRAGVTFDDVIAGGIITRVATDARRRAITALHERGDRPQEIARWLNVTTRTVWRALTTEAVA